MNVYLVGETLDILACAWVALSGGGSRGTTVEVLVASGRCGGRRLDIGFSAPSLLPGHLVYHYKPKSAAAEYQVNSTQSIFHPEYWLRRPTEHIS